MLTRERRSSDATCRNAWNVQGRDTAASQIPATGRSWDEQRDSPQGTSPAFCPAESSTVGSVQSPLWPAPGQGWGEDRAAAMEGGTIAELSLLPPQPAWSPGELLVCRKSAGGRKEGKTGQRPLLTAHGHHNPNPSSRLGDGVQPALILHLGHVPWSPSPSRREPEGPDVDPGPLPRLAHLPGRDALLRSLLRVCCSDAHGRVTQSCLFKVKQQDSPSTLRECVELPLIIFWTTPENHAFQ